MVLVIERPDGRFHVVLFISASKRRQLHDVVVALVRLHLRLRLRVYCSLTGLILSAAMCLPWRTSATTFSIHNDASPCVDGFASTATSSPLRSEKAKLLSEET